MLATTQLDRLFYLSTLTL